MNGPSSRVSRPRSVLSTASASANSHNRLVRERSSPGVWGPRNSITHMTPSSCFVNFKEPNSVLQKRCLYFVTRPPQPAALYLTLYFFFAQPPNPGPSAPPKWTPSHRLFSCSHSLFTPST